MKRFVLLSILALALAGAQVAQASTIQLAIRTGAPTGGWLHGMQQPSLCGVTDPFSTRVACAGTNSVVITDGSALAGALDANGVASAITWSGTIGVWSVVVTGTGYDYLGLGKMDLNFSVTSSGPDPNPLEIYFSQIGNPSSASVPTFLMNFGGSANHGTADYGAGLCNADMKNFMVASSLGESGWVGGSGHLSWEAATGATQGHIYSLTQRVQFLSGGPGANFNGTAEIEVVPEPASLLLLGTGLIGAVRAARRKRG